MKMNDIQGAYNSQASSKMTSGPFALQNGRILHVTVGKLLGEGMAEVSAAGRKFIAKLDAPLEAGREYWMRVQQTEDVLSLNVIQRISGMKDSMEAAQALIRQFHYQTSDKTLLDSVSKLIDNDIPITSELMKFISEKVNGENANIRLPVLMHMLKARLPLSDKVLLSLEAGKGQETISGLLNRLKERLSALGGAHDTLELIKRIQNPLGSYFSKQMTVKAMVNALNQSEPFSVRHASYELLQSLGILPKGTSFQNMETALNHALSSSIQKNGATPKQILDLIGSMRDLLSHPLNGARQHDIDGVISALTKESGRGGKANKAMVDLALNTIHRHSPALSKEGAMERIIGNLVDLIKGSDKQLLEKNYSAMLLKWEMSPSLSNEGKIFNMLNAGIEEGMMSTLKGKELGQVLKRMIQTLGLNFESQLHSQPDADFQPLKEKLIRLILQNPVPEVRELAEKLVHKLNHPALVSWEQSSVLNIIQQFPLYLFGRQTDITVQWTGREKEKGRIDSDHCRILFYLHLGNLNETLVDMNVQNRIISLTIWNENEGMNDLAQSYIPVLKESLQPMDYQLTSVKFKKVNDQDSISQKRIHEMQAITYSGVDLKI
jgi:hypothetical protein